jgi:ankyrin repeat protein
MDVPFTTAAYSNAVANGREDLVELFHRARRDEDEFLCPDDKIRRSTHLIWAAATGNRAVVAHAIKKGKADIDKEGRLYARSVTPLMAAAWEGQAEIVSLLLEHEADPNCEIKYGCRMEGTNDDVVVIWMSTTPLTYAAEGGDPKVVRCLLEHGARHDVGGRTPLSLAVMFGHVRAVRLLLDYGADVDARNPLDRISREEATFPGDTALYHAASHGFPAIVKLLFAYGAGRSKQELREALGVAVGNYSLSGHYSSRRRGLRAVIKLLLAHGAPLDYRDSRGYTLLGLAEFAEPPWRPNPLRELIEREIERRHTAGALDGEKTQTTNHHKREVSQGENAPLRVTPQF